MMVRIEGWEGRLLELVDEAASWQYELGVQDCFRFACRAVEVLTGVDRWPEFAGRYRTKREAAALLASYGSNFEAAFDWFFGVTRVSWRMARRGDVIGYADPQGEKHLMVCTGQYAVGLLESGIVRMPFSRGYCAWRVG